MSKTQGNFMKLIAPLTIQLSKNKKFILNLNQYRNTHHFPLNNAKKAFKEYLWHLVPKNHFDAPVRIIYELYPQRKCDLMNVCSIVDKFICDILVEKGVLNDDSIHEVQEVTSRFIGIDKLNPRCEIKIELIEKTY